MKFYQTSLGKYFIILSYCIIIIITSLFRFIAKDAFRESKINNTKRHLSILSAEVSNLYNMMDTTKKGFSCDGDQLFIGNQLVSENNELIDQLKDDFGADFSIFFKDRRVATTIIKTDGSRYTNTSSPEIWNNYIKKGNSYFDTNLTINNLSYMGYYVPLTDQNNNIIGMCFAGIPSSNIEKELYKMGRKMFVVSLLICIICFLIIYYLAQFFIKIQNHITRYLNEIIEGNYSHQLPEYITKRTDEYGALGNLIVTINDSLSNTIEKDSLTKIYNRRAAMKHLEKDVKMANSMEGFPFTFAIGDIDFFKKVNDTYGHSCGDVVLKRIAAILQNGVQDCGYVARWGGEEFILVFHNTLQPSIERLQTILDTIRQEVVVYDDKSVSVTMTFGIVQYKSPQGIDWMISYADKLLYYGKEHGRNTIITTTKKNKTE